MNVSAPRIGSAGWVRRGLWAAVLAGAAVLAAAGAAAAQGGFDDAGGVYEPVVDALAAEGILEGTECGEGRFCPDEPLRRWTAAVWIIRAEDENPSRAPTRFADVDADAWWASYVERLAELGVSGGCAADPPRYCPDDPMTRGQAAAFMASAFGLEAGQRLGFADTAGHRHARSIDALVSAALPRGAPPIRSGMP